MIKDYQHDNIKLSFQLSPDKSMVLIAYKLAQIPIIIFFTWTRSSFWISLNLKSPQSCFSFIFCCFYSTWFCSQEIIQLNRVHSLCLRNSSAVLVPVALCGVKRYLQQNICQSLLERPFASNRDLPFQRIIEKLHSFFL